MQLQSSDPRLIVRRTFIEFVDGRPVEEGPPRHRSEPSITTHFSRRSSRESAGSGAHGSHGSDAPPLKGVSEHDDADAMSDEHFGSTSGEDKSGSEDFQGGLPQSDLLASRHRSQGSNKVSSKRRSSMKSNEARRVQKEESQPLEMAEMQRRLAQKDDEIMRLRAELAWTREKLGMVPQDVIDSCVCPHEQPMTETSTSSSSRLIVKRTFLEVIDGSPKNDRDRSASMPVTSTLADQLETLEDGSCPHLTQKLLERMYDMRPTKSENIPPRHYDTPEGTVISGETRRSSSESVKAVVQQYSRPIVADRERQQALEEEARFSRPSVDSEEHFTRTPSTSEELRSYARSSATNNSACYPPGLSQYGTSRASTSGSKLPATDARRSSRLSDTTLQPCRSPEQAPFTNEASLSRSSMAYLLQEEEEAIRQLDVCDDGEPDPSLGPRTTVMLRNLPVSYTRDMLLQLLDSEGFFAQYDFVYLPIDFGTRSGFGYAFINLVDFDCAKSFWDHFHGFTAWSVPSTMVAEVTWSTTHQGMEQHVSRYRNSPVMHQTMPDECKPIVLQQGRRVDFPPPTKSLRPPRIRPAKTRTGRHLNNVPALQHDFMAQGNCTGAMQMHLAR